MTNQAKKRKKKRLAPATRFYLIVIGIAIILAIIALFYVRSLLVRYEACQPERRVEEVVDKMRSEAKKGMLWNYYEFPAVTDSEYESTDLKTLYAEALTKGELKIVPRAGAQTETSKVFEVRTEDGLQVAEVTLSAVGEQETKLLIFNFQDWEVKDAAITVRPLTYQIDAPDGFDVTVNGIHLDESLGEVEQEGVRRYTVRDLCLVPEVKITAPDGTELPLKKSGTRIRAVFYKYLLTLPDTLTVTVNGEEITGEEADGMISYRIFTVDEPTVIISDQFGGTVPYTGDGSIPLTVCELIVNETDAATVDGRAVTGAKSRITRPDPDFEELGDYLARIPQLVTYRIAVLRDDAEIGVLHQDGSVEVVDVSEGKVDLTKRGSGQSVPDDIASEIDVLKAVETWSLFMSTDLDGVYYGIYNITPYLIEGSSLYNQAWNWINSIDITFISIHTLASPAFTGESVTNYRRVADNCFTVDVRFDKNMLISGVNPLADSMNTRVTFIRYNNEWKMVQMKEILE